MKRRSWWLLGVLAAMSLAGCAMHTVIWETADTEAPTYWRTVSGYEMVVYWGIPAWHPHYIYYGDFASCEAFRVNHPTTPNWVPPPYRVDHDCTLIHGTEHRWPGRRI